MLVNRPDNPYDPNCLDMRLAHDLMLSDLAAEVAEHL